jgi:hypothetical protein
MFDPQTIQSGDSTLSNQFSALILAFVQKKIKTFCEEKTSKATIQNVFLLSQIYLSPAQKQSLLLVLIEALNLKVCHAELISNEESYSLQRQLRQEYDFHRNVLDGDPINILKIKEQTEGDAVQLKRFRSNIELDQDTAGRSMLITQNLTEVYKVNNLYHFNIDFQSAVRVNKLKLVFDEKSKKNLYASFKMRVNVSIPELPHLSQEETNRYANDPEAFSIKA